MNKTFTCTDQDVKELLIVGFDKHFFSTLTSFNDYESDSYSLNSLDSSVSAYKLSNGMCCTEQTFTLCDYL